MRWVAALLLLIVATLSFAQPPTGTGKLYAVIFDVTVDSTGMVDTLKVAKVIDPSSGTTDEVRIDVPDSYLRAAGAWLMKRKYGAETPRFDTWLFFDPNRPDRADIDPESGRP
jgi:hypothetical protein